MKFILYLFLLIITLITIVVNKLVNEALNQMKFIGIDSSNEQNMMFWIVNFIFLIYYVFYFTVFYYITFIGG